MKILLAVALLAVSCLIFCACQKDVHNNISRAINTNPNDSVLLSKYIELDTTLPSGLDTIFRILYTYDNEKRLKKYDISDNVDNETSELFYSGTDTLPFKAVNYWTNYGDIYRDTVFIFYSNGTVRKDSVIEYDNGTNQLIWIESRDFIAIGNNTLIQLRRYQAPGPSADYEANGTIYKTYNRANIVVQDDSTFSTIGFAFKKHEEVKYDNKINPFYKAIPVHYPILNYWLIAQPNNPIDNILWEDPSHTEHFLYAYTYRQDGFPVSVNVTDQSYSDGWKGLFFYTK